MHNIVRSTLANVLLVVSLASVFAGLILLDVAPVFATLATIVVAIAVKFDDHRIRRARLARA